jgi:hypothetical protein
MQVFEAMTAGVIFSAGKLFRVVQSAGDRNVPAPLTFDLRNWQKDRSYRRGDILVPLQMKRKGQECPFSVGYTSAPAGLPAPQKKSHPQITFTINITA